ncbi:hypothetical protein BFP70_10770 [Thioclava sp. SK-1]|uniref:DUF3467 domain-containing protein n=1 Tax=Thioclava sp. SK-1 TaxID=1889770 RepID=UPI00082450A8|nr:DUF3467 domain-containing protein [Thioclava sp. SK-1]OCX64515.1 hypothetical protein BFP70_10770 [Thioclava sp. SK-1]
MASTDQNETAQKSEKPTRDVRVRFDDTKMSSNYANVANVGMSKDEVTLLFGTNQTWGAVEEEVVIALSSRIILTPSVAKSLSETLQRVLGEYEKQVGKIA